MSFDGMQVTDSILFIDSVLPPQSGTISKIEEALAQIVTGAVWGGNVWLILNVVIERTLTTSRSVL
jgi:hypothetical protein